jgi:hypothetical protein
VDNNLTVAPPKKRKIMLDKLRLFARPAAILGPGTLDALAVNLTEEERLRDTLSKALEWRKVGARSEADFAIWQNRPNEFYVHPSEPSDTFGLSEDDIQLCDKVGVPLLHCAVVKRLFHLIKPQSVHEALTLVNPKVIGASWRANHKVRKPLSESELNELLVIFVQALFNSSTRPFIYSTLPLNR